MKVGTAGNSCVKIRSIPRHDDEWQVCNRMPSRSEGPAVGGCFHNRRKVDILDHQQVNIGVQSGYADVGEARLAGREVGAGGVGSGLEGCVLHDERGQKTESSGENLHLLRQTLSLAQEMGTGMGNHPFL